MKKVIFAFAFILAVSSAFGQRQFKQWYPAVDTCDNTETITFTWSESFWKSGSVQLGVVVDSLSGSGDPTIYVDVSPHCNGTQFTNVASQAVSGAQTEYEYEDTDFSACRIRVRVVGSGTQSHKAQVSGIFKDER